MHNPGLVYLTRAGRKSRKAGMLEYPLNIRRHVVSEVCYRRTSENSKSTVIKTRLILGAPYSVRAAPQADEAAALLTLVTCGGLTLQHRHALLVR